MPSVSKRLRHTRVAHALIKRDRRTSNKETELEIRTLTYNVMNKRRLMRMRIRR